MPRRNDMTFANENRRAFAKEASQINHQLNRTHPPMSVLLETSLGDIVIDLYVKKCPKTCENFIKLCKTKYYNFCLFHNVQKGFMVQTGDPQGNGTGGESVWGWVCFYFLYTYILIYQHG